GVPPAGPRCGSGYSRPTAQAASAGYGPALPGGPPPPAESSGADECPDCGGIVPGRAGPSRPPRAVPPTPCTGWPAASLLPRGALGASELCGVLRPTRRFFLAGGGMRQAPLSPNGCSGHEPGVGVAPALHVRGILQENGLDEAHLSLGEMALPA